MNFPITVKLKINNPWNVTHIVVNSLHISTVYPILIYSQSEYELLSNIEKYLVVESEY